MRGAFNMREWNLPWEAGGKLPWATTPADHSFKTLAALDRCESLVKEHEQWSTTATASS
jgi:hypothetical protein